MEYQRTHDHLQEEHPITEDSNEDTVTGDPK